MGHPTLEAPGAFPHTASAQMALYPRNDADDDTVEEGIATPLLREHTSGTSVSKVPPCGHIWLYFCNSGKTT